jgi:hypothetical protein
VKVRKLSGESVQDINTDNYISHAFDLFPIKPYIKKKINKYCALRGGSTDETILEKRREEKRREEKRREVFRGFRFLAFW